MNTDDRIVKILEDLQAGQKAILADVETLKDGQAHTHTVLKTLATKQDVEVAVDAAKTELEAKISEVKSDVLMLDSKVAKKIQSHERRITNLEEQSGIENPEKH